MKQVLVVDDEASIRQVIRDILRDEGYSVILATGGHNMMKILETEHPDLVLLDVMMPDGDGPAAFQAMQSQPGLRDIPVVMMSTGAARRQLTMHAVDFLEKPFDLDHLLEAVISTIGPAS